MGRSLMDVGGREDTLTCSASSIEAFEDVGVHSCSGRSSLGTEEAPCCAFPSDLCSILLRLNGQLSLSTTLVAADSLCVIAVVSRHHRGRAVGFDTMFSDLIIRLECIL